MDRLEVFESVLDFQFNQLSVKDYILPLAFRNAIALATSLENAFILTRQLPIGTDENAPPEICSALEVWGISCQYLTSQDSIVAMESNNLRQLLIHTNTAKVVWSGVHLAALHLLLPSALGFQKTSEPSQSTALLHFQKSIDNPELHRGFLAGVRGFWYLI